MFEGNDKALLAARIIVKVTIGIFAVAFLALGIALAVLMEGVYFLIAPAGWFLCWNIWVFTRLYLSYLCDIKLIRNKLYGESNDELNAFLMSVKTLEKKEKAAELEEAKLALEELYRSDMIDREEYEKQKIELENREIALNDREHK